MLFRVDASSEVSLADQIAGQVRGALIGGQLKPGERLPAARQVAAGLDVNMHTVLRAYAVLRDEGVIELRRGRGAVVRDEVDVAALSMDQAVADFVARARDVGWSADRAARAVRDAMRER